MIAFDILTIFIAVILFLWWVVSDDGEVFTPKFFLVLFALIFRYLIVGVWYYFDIRRIFGKSRIDSVSAALGFIISSAFLVNDVYLLKREEFLKKRVNKKP